MESLFAYPYFEAFLQIILAMVLGSVLGFQRYFIGKTAGMRTYSLVSMGACLFILISAMVVGGPLFETTNIDPLHVMAGIITGIGFLGAGLIIFKDSKLTGLTTAAGLWVAAGIGIAVGYKFYAIAIFTTLVTLFNFTILWRIERSLKHIADKADKEDMPDMGGQ